jgi:hypothetical protein
MNTRKRYLILLILSFGMCTVIGCKEERKTTTKINRDGSCERVFVLKSISDTSSAFPFPPGLSWQTRMENDTVERFNATKSYGDVNRINDDYAVQGKVGIEVTFEKKFRWFYTYFDYKETYKSYYPFHAVSLKSFLTEEEYSRYEKGDTSKALKDRMEEFMSRNIIEEYLAQLVDSVTNLHNPSIPAAAFIALKKEMLSHFGDTTYLPLLDLMKGPSEMALERATGLQLRGKIEHTLKNIEKSLDTKYEFMSSISADYVNEVVMPGIIMNTNADEIDGSKVSWKFDDEKFALIDYVMTVESRIANPWAMYVTGGLVIVMLILLLLPRLRARPYLQ